MVIFLKTVEKSQFVINPLTALLHYSDRTSTRICLTALAPYFNKVANWAFGGCSL